MAEVVDNTSFIICGKCKHPKPAHKFLSKNGRRTTKLCSECRGCSDRSHRKRRAMERAIKKAASGENETQMVTKVQKQTGKATKEEKETTKVTKVQKQTGKATKKPNLKGSSPVAQTPIPPASPAAGVPTQTSVVAQHLSQPVGDYNSEGDVLNASFASLVEHANLNAVTPVQEPGHGAAISSTLGHAANNFQNQENMHSAEARVSGFPAAEESQMTMSDLLAGAAGEAGERSEDLSAQSSSWYFYADGATGNIWNTDEWGREVMMWGTSARQFSLYDMDGMEMNGMEFM